MKKSLLYIAVATATAISITACSSGSDVAGIGGSGVTSSGTITGFGSIFVNGVEFETSSSSFDVEDKPNPTEDDLAIGMRVTVKGTVNSDGVTGTATSVTFDDEAQGPVSNLQQLPYDTTRSLTVLGRQVLIDSTATNFDKSSDVPPAETFDFVNIFDTDYVEVSGYFDSAGVLIATRVELKARPFNHNNNSVELKGTITGLNGAGTSFKLINVTGVTINTSGATIIDDLPNNQLADGAFVEVKGACASGTCTTINASRVEGESAGFDNDDDVELEGIITRYASDSDFDVNDFPVDASSAQKEPASLVLAEDLLVEVEGSIINGVLVATEVEQEGGEIKIAAKVTGIPTANSFELLPVSTEPSITIKIDTSTEIEDELADINSAALLSVMNPGDFMVVEGYDDGTGTVIAKSVDREKAVDDVILQGVVTETTGDATSGTVTILGVKFQVDGTTDFEDENDVDYSNDNDFFNDITPFGTKMAKIKDESSGGNAVGLADEVDLEN